MNPQHVQRVYFEQLKKTVPIGAILARYNIALKRSGNKSLKGRCPIHQGTSASFVVDENENLWHCFSPKCESRGGGILELVSELEGNIGIREAALLIAEWFAVKPGSDVQHRTVKRSTAMSDHSKPTHKVYSAQKREGQKDWLTFIGSGWVFEFEDKEKGVRRSGMNIQLSAMPLGERLVIFEADAEQEEKKEAANNNGKFAKRK